MSGKIEMPPEFAAVATLPIPELAVRFGVSRSTAQKWRVRLGVHVPPGAPKGNQNGTVRKRENYGQDSPEQVRACLNCTAGRCVGQCYKVR